MARFINLPDIDIQLNLFEKKMFLTVSVKNLSY